MLRGNKHIHFVGIGGIGMSGLAEILLNLNYDVTGSDKVASYITDRLADHGAVIFLDHHANHIGTAELVVISSAIAPDNPELREAHRCGIPVITRGDLLADLVRQKPNAIAVAGAHGKTSTTSMIAAILDETEIESTMIVGGILRRKGKNARWGQGNYLVTETDEHDGSFLKLSPTVCVVTNIDREHLAYYKSIDNIKQAFCDFVQKVPFYGFSVLCAEDAHVIDMAQKANVQKIFYGFQTSHDVYPSAIEHYRDGEYVCMRFHVHNTNPQLGPRGDLGRVLIKAFGMHNVLNCLAGIAVALGLGIDFETIQRGLLQFEGVERRLQIKKTTETCVLIEDYAHHPTEIRETIKAVRMLGRKRLIAVFQPHLYSRTKDHMGEFIQELALADLIIITAIYKAREEPIKGVSAFQIVEGIKKDDSKKEVYYFENKDDIPKALSLMLQEDDVVLVMGAGNIYTVTDQMVRLLSMQEVT